MSILNKVTQKATNMGKSTINTVAKIGASATTTAQEQTELIQVKSQMNVIERELDAFYVQIGRRYVDYVLETGDMAGIELEDLLKLMEPNMAKKQELEKRVAELEKEIKRKTILRERQQVEMNLITKEERNAKIKELTE